MKPLKAAIGALSPDVFSLDHAAEVARIADFLKQSTRGLNRRGVVVGVGQQGDAQTALLLGVRQRGVQRFGELAEPCMQQTKTGIVYLGARGDCRRVAVEGNQPPGRPQTRQNRATVTAATKGGIDVGAFRLDV